MMANTSDSQGAPMPPSPDDGSPEQPRSAAFPTTLWTVVFAASGEADESRRALTQICQAYWYPLYVFVRRRGVAAHDAQDLTQAYFAHLLERHALTNVRPEAGRFRTFLLAALKHFLANERERAAAQKRGGGVAVVSLTPDPESRFQLEPRDNWTPEREFERQWALALLGRVLDGLRRECRREHQEGLFDELKPTLLGEGGSYAEIARRLGRTEGSVKVAAHRLRARFRERLREEIAQTVPEGEVDDELRELIAALRHPD